MLNLAAIHEAIAAAIPDRECLVFRERRLTWARRHRPHAAGSPTCCARHGLGCRRERARAREPRVRAGPRRALPLQRQRVPRGHARRDARRARVPFNVNYRYVDEELLYLFRDADARAVIYHARFAPTLARIRAAAARARAAAPGGRRLGRGAAAGRDSTTRRRSPPPSPRRRAVSRPTTSTSSTPAARRACRRACCGGRRTSSSRRSRRAACRRASTRSSSARSARPRAALRCPRRRSCTAPRTGSRSAMWHVGGTIVVQSQPERLDPHDVWATVERERVDALTIVGDAFARPLARRARRAAATTCPLAEAAHVGRRDPLRGAARTSCSRRIPSISILDALGILRERPAGVAGDGVGRHARRPATSCSADDNACSTTSSPASSRRAAAARAGSRSAAPCRSATSATPRRRRARSPSIERRALLGARRPRGRASRRPAASPRPRLGHDQHAAARRSSPRRSSTRSSTTPTCATRSSSARRTSASASR